MTTEVRDKSNPEDYRRRSVTALLAFVVISSLFYYTFRLVRVKGHSMDPTYSDGQWLLVRRPNWPSRAPRVGDVVVFWLDNELLVKRVAAVGGQLAPEHSAILVIQPSHKRPEFWEAAIVPTEPQMVPKGQ